MNTTTTNNSDDNANEFDSNWFNNVSIKSIGLKLKNYASACRNLSYNIKNLTKIDFTIFDEIFRPNLNIKIENNKIFNQQQQQLNNQNETAGQSLMTNELDIHDTSPHNNILLDDSSLHNLAGSNDDFLLKNQKNSFQQFSSFNEYQFDSQQRNLQQHHHHSHNQHHHHQHQQPTLQQPLQQQQQQQQHTSTSSSITNPSIVIYMIDPFDYSQTDENTSELDGNDCKRLVTIGFKT
jgi:hypothetical protein